MNRLLLEIGMHESGVAGRDYEEGIVVDVIIKTVQTIAQEFHAGIEGEQFVGAGGNKEFVGLVPIEKLF